MGLEVFAQQMVQPGGLGLVVPVNQMWSDDGRSFALVYMDVYVDVAGFCTFFLAVESKLFGHWQSSWRSKPLANP